MTSTPSSTTHRIVRLLAVLVTIVAASTAAVDVPYSAANRIIAENLHSTDQAFIEVHEIVRSMSRACNAIRGRAESAILGAVRSFDSHRDDPLELIALVRQLDEQLVTDLVDEALAQHADMDEMVEIAVDLHDTNWMLTREVPQIQTAMSVLQGLTKSKYDQLDTLLVDWRRDTGRMRNQKLAQAQSVALELKRLRGRGGAGSATASAEKNLERIFLALLDEQRAIVLVARARSRSMMTALEHQFRINSLELTLAEHRATVERG